MTKVKKHLNISEETFDKFEKYRISNNMKPSKAAEKLIILGLENMAVLDRLKVIERMTNDNIKLIFSNYSLLKQFYSDMQFTNYTDVKKCDLLNRFLKEKRIDKYND